MQEENTRACSVLGEKKKKSTSQSCPQTLFLNISSWWVYFMTQGHELANETVKNGKLKTDLNVNALKRKWLTLCLFYKILLVVDILKNISSATWMFTQEAGMSEERRLHLDSPLSRICMSSELHFYELKFLIQVSCLRTKQSDSSLAGVWYSRPVAA